MSEDTGETADSAPEPPVEPDSIAAPALARQVRSGTSVRILDVRDRDETDAWRIDGPSVSFTQLPLSRFLQAQVTGGVDDLVLEVDGDGPITAVCGRGEASGYVAGLLVDHGTEARNLAGGMRAWADVYLGTVLIEGTPTVVQYDRPATGCLGYAITDGTRAAVVDPLQAFTDRYVADAADRDLDIVAVLDTHLHADHVSGRSELAEAADATAYVPAETADRGVDGDVETIEWGDSIPIGDVALEAVGLPGHTTDMTGYVVGDVLLAGDSVFLDGVARPDLQEEGDTAAMAADLHLTLTERLDTFDDDILVGSGHHRLTTPPDDEGRYVARLGDLRDRLAAFSATESELVERLTDDLPPEPANADRIVAANRGEESLAEETAQELELGPNNCAA